MQIRLHRGLFLFRFSLKTYDIDHLEMLFQYFCFVAI